MTGRIPAAELRTLAAEMATPEGVARISALAAIIPVAFFVKDHEGRYIVVNSIARQAMTGDPAGVVEGRTAEDFYRGDTAEAFAAVDREAIEQRSPVEREVVVYDHRRGAKRRYLTARAPLYDAAGTFCGIVGTSSDITAQRELEEKAAAVLQESEAKLRSILDTVPITVWMTNAEGRNIFVNRRWEETSGQEDGDNLDGGWLAAVHPDDRERVAQVWMESVRNRTIERQEYRVRNTAGEYVWAITTGAPRFDESGEYMGHVGVVIDINERKKAEQALAAAKEQAEEQDRSKSRFLAAASHDLRQPMQSLTFCVDALRKHLRGDGELAYQRLRRNIAMLRNLLDGLLDVTRLDHGLVQPKSELVKLDDIINDIYDTHRPAAHEKGLMLFCVPTDACIRTDRALMTRLLNNLVENAVRYTQKGRILIDTVMRGDHVEISVRDSGIGIADNQLSLIWNEFHQVNNPSHERSRGMGLGLSIVRRLSDLLGCPVRVESRLGHGTTFTVTIPVVADDSNVVPIAKPRNEPFVAAVDGHEPLILIVDDDPMLRDAFEAIFETVSEWRVVLAANVAEAKRIMPRRPDIAILDYRLDDTLTGDQGIDDLRQHWDAPDLLAILLTGDTEMAVSARAEAQHMRLLHKPVDAMTLIETISSMLRGIGREARASVEFIHARKQSTQ